MSEPSDFHTSYLTLLQQRLIRSPCLSALERFLRVNVGSSQPCRVTTVDYNNQNLKTLGSPAVNLSDEDTKTLISLTQIPENATGRLLVVEDISAHFISVLGTILDINPMFFANHVSTEFKDIELQAAPSSLALFPSYWASRPDMFHIQYQRVVDLGKESDYKGQHWAVDTHGNIPRKLRRLPAFRGRQIGIARGCISTWKSKVGTSWVGMLRKLED
jgi:hypothetical protein